VLSSPGGKKKNGEIGPVDGEIDSIRATPGGGDLMEVGETMGEEVGDSSLI